MTEAKSHRVAILWRGDRLGRAEARADNNRLRGIFEALERRGIAAEPAVWAEDLTNEVRAQILAVDGVLVWVDPISTATGERREALKPAAQALERVAHCRLAQAQPLAGARHVALAHDRVEHDEQLEVERVPVHGRGL